MKAPTVKLRVTLQSALISSLHQAPTHNSSKGHLRLQQKRGGGGKKGREKTRGERTIASKPKANRLMAAAAAVGRNRAAKVMSKKRSGQNGSFSVAGQHKLISNNNNNNRNENKSNPSTNKTISAAGSCNRLLILFSLLALALGQETQHQQLQQQQQQCKQVYFGAKEQSNICCQCDESHCDLLQLNWPSDDFTYLRLVSDKAGARFQQSELRSLPFLASGLKENNNNKGAQQASPAAAHYTVEVRVNRRHQQVVGFGGAFTDSASQLINSLSGKTRQSLLNDYFSASGLDYNMGRVPIAGTDMSTRAYSYDDLPKGQEDLELSKFSLQPEDLEEKIPLIRDVNKMRSLRKLEPLKLMAASWSAPAWMKSNNNLVQGRLRGASSGPYYDAYARYVVKFLHEYEKQNVSMWALSPQNEPLSPKRVGPVRINFNSVNFEPEEMVDYLENNLVPTLLKAGKSADKLKLFIWDDTLDGLEKYQQAALSAPNVRKFAHGLAIHWYSQGLNEISYKGLYDARRQLPQQYCMMSTEASFIGRPKPGEWFRGQRYARDLMENLRVGSVGWVDWNLALNMSGGPTWSHNYLDAAVLIDRERGIYYKNPMFYTLGHLTRFIQPRSYIVTSNIYPLGTKEPMQSGGLQDELAAVAAELEEPLQVEEANSEGGGQFKRRLSVVLLNRVAQARKVRLNLVECRAKETQAPLELELTPNSITSLAFVC